MLKVSKLTKRYGKKMAIEDISFDVSRGEIVGLLGHNGSGKSTTMNIITGCLSPTDGSVTVDGHSIIAEPENAKREIGYLPENPPVYPDMTVEEQLEFAADLRGIRGSAKREAIGAACRQVHIQGARPRLIRNLSKGYRQRVGFAQALIGEPGLLILDEPTVGLDPSQIIEIRQLIMELGKQHTIILSSHILSEISAVCRRIVMLSNGRLVADDTPENLMRGDFAPGTMILKADGDREVICQVIMGLPGIHMCVPRTKGPDGEPEFLIEPEEGVDLHEALFYGLAKACCPIRSLSPVQADLEEVFIRLTKDRRYEEANL